MARKSKFTEEQMVYAVKQLEAGIPIEELGRKYGVSTRPSTAGEASMVGWRSQRSGVSKQLEEENRKLKQLVADLSLEKQILQDVVQKRALKPGDRSSKP